jgi:hypothetical protein
MKGLVRRFTPLALLVTTVAWADGPRDATPRPEAPTPPPTSASSIEPFTFSGNTISLKVSHNFARALARERLGFLFDYWRQRFGVEIDWRGDRAFVSGRVFGVEIRARFDVSDTAVTGVAADPGWLWRGKAESYVTQKLRKYLHPHYADP